MMAGMWETFLQLPVDVAEHIVACIIAQSPWHGLRAFREVCRQARTLANQAVKLAKVKSWEEAERAATCLLYTSPSPRDGLLSRMPSSA